MAYKIKFFFRVLRYGPEKNVFHYKFASAQFLKLDDSINCFADSTMLHFKLAENMGKSFMKLMYCALEDRKCLQK